MKTVDIHEAKTHLSRLIEDVAAGDEVVITRNGKPAARLLPFALPSSSRRPGPWRGRVEIGADFDAPLPPTLAVAFG